MHYYVVWVLIMAFTGPQGQVQSTVVIDNLNSELGCHALADQIAGMSPPTDQGPPAHRCVQVYKERP